MASVAEIFDRHHTAVFAYLRRRVRSVADAEDLCQDVFLRAHRALPRYVSTGRDAAWVFRIARNVLLNFKRGDARAPQPVESAEPDTMSAGSVASSEQTIDLGRALDELPEQDADAFLLREAGGLGYDEIAAVTGATPDAVRNRIFRARMALRTALGAARRMSR